MRAGLPINILNPRPGTPLEGRQATDPAEVVKTVAIFRFIHPKANIKLAGGRELNLGVYFQEKALRGGVNGLVVSGYLTTPGKPLQEDLDMLRRAGFFMETTHEYGCGSAKTPSCRTGRGGPSPVFQAGCTSGCEQKT